MYPTAYDVQLQHERYLREAEQYRLAHQARDVQPNLWQRLRVNLSGLQSAARPTLETNLSNDVAAACQC